MNIKITSKEETGRTIYTALTVTVKTDKEEHILDTVLIREYTANPECCTATVDEFEWVTPEPEGSKQAEIEEAAEKYILGRF